MNLLLKETILLSATKATLGAAALLALSSAGASATTFTGNFSLSGSAFSDPGLVINANPASGPVSFDLDEGESTTFDLFRVWTNETFLNDDDVVPDTVSAAFEFTSPVAGGTVNGGSVGLPLLEGIIQVGFIGWTAPLEISYGNGGLLRIELSDEFFNPGVFGLFAGKQFGATVQATVTYVSAPIAPVPLPAAAWLLGAALAGLGLAARKRPTV